MKRYFTNSVMLSSSLEKSWLKNERTKFVLSCFEHKICSIATLANITCHLEFSSTFQKTLIIDIAMNATGSESSSVVYNALGIIQNLSKKVQFNDDLQPILLSLLSVWEDFVTEHVQFSVLIVTSLQNIFQANEISDLNATYVLNQMALMQDIIDQDCSFLPELLAKCENGAKDQTVVTWNGQVVKPVKELLTVFGQQFT